MILLLVSTLFYVVIFKRCHFFVIQIPLTIASSGLDGLGDFKRGNLKFAFLKSPRVSCLYCEACTFTFEVKFEWCYNVLSLTGFQKLHSVFQTITPYQRAKKVVSDSLGLVDLAVGPVNSVPTGKSISSGNLQKNCCQSCSSKIFFFGLFKLTLGLEHVSCCFPEWQAVELTFFAPCLFLVLLY